MAQLLIQKKNLRDLIYTATESEPVNPSLRTIDHLLSGAANEGISITFLLFCTVGIDKLLPRFGIRRVRKLVSELLSILIDKTPDDLYVDCPGQNEFLLLLPGVTKTDAHHAGMEIRKRFLEAIKTIVKEPASNADLVGSVISFPSDGKTTAELLCQAHDAISLAILSESAPIQIVQPIRLLPFSVDLPEIQISRLRQSAKNLGISEANLIRQALDDFLQTKI